MELNRITIVLLMFLSVSIEGLKQDPLMNLPGYAVTAYIDQLNATKCQKEMQEFRNAVDQRVLWGLRMLDSSGQQASGFTVGNNYWQGSREECELLSKNLFVQISERNALNISKYRDPDKEFPPFELNFFSAHAHHNSVLQYHIEIITEDIIVIGLCLPASCSENEVGVMLRKVFDDKLLLTGQLYSVDFELLRVSDLRDDYTWMLDGGKLTIIFVLAIIAGTVLVGTLYDCFVYQPRVKRGQLRAYSNQYDTEVNCEIEDKQNPNQEQMVSIPMKPDSRIAKFLLCFSFCSNIQLIFQWKNTNDIEAIHGIRFIGMLWIILAHVFYYTLDIVGNKIQLVVSTQTFEKQFINNAILAVDVFFLMGGFLMAHSHLKSSKKNKKFSSFKTEIGIFVSSVIKRYLRLTPTYAMVIMLAIILNSNQEKRVLWHYTEAIAERCTKHWWKNLLYINNFFDWSNICLTWSWYLPNDMQFFIFGNFLMILSKFYYYAALMIGIAILIFSMFMNGYMTYTLELIPTLGDIYRTMDDMYIQPWQRIQPYIIGMLAAMLLSKWNYKLPLSKRVIAICWTLSILCNVSILHVLINRNISLGWSIFYHTFTKMAWSVGGAWFIIACITGNGGIVNRFLSFPGWVPFSRVTLCAYLLNPFLALLFTANSDFPIYTGTVPSIIMFLGITVATYILSFALSAISEIPASMLLQMVKGSNERNK